MSGRPSAPQDVCADRKFLTSLFDAALEAASPSGKFTELPDPPPAGGDVVVLGGGKAAASMLAAFEDSVRAAGWRRPLRGLVVAPYGHVRPLRRDLEDMVVEAAHPTPDAAGLQAAARILDLAAKAAANDLVVFLLSGGASSLLAAPASGADWGVTLAAKQAVTKALLKSGAPIEDMNRVRQGLSAVKGGRLAAAAAPARCVTYAISDVPGDDPRVIGSGPTLPPLKGEAPLSILERWRVPASDAVQRTLERNAAAAPEPHPVHIIATPQQALAAAAERAGALGVPPLMLGDALEGEAREVARVLAGIARSALRHGHPAPAPAVLLSGGETTVTVRGSGRGGRNAEFLLALAIALGDDLAQVSALACDTDGIDGVETNAGAFIDATTLIRAAAAGLDPRAFLENNDAYGFFDALGDLFVTRPTRTNVNDFRAILVR